MRTGHLLAMACVLLLAGCAHSSRRPPARQKKPNVGERPRLRDLYARDHVAEVPLPTPPPVRRAAARVAFDLTPLLHRDGASIRACYRTAHGRRGAPLEPVRLEVELETGGRRVRSVQINGTRNGRLERCLSRRIRRWRLPARTPRRVSLLLVLAGS
jgi:hypothetical protein